MKSSASFIRRGNGAAAPKTSLASRTFFESVLMKEARLIMGKSIDCLSLNFWYEVEACQYRVRDGMQVRLQRGWREPGGDDES